MKSETRGLRTWIEIDRKAVKHNFQVFKSLIAGSKKKSADSRDGRVKLMAVVKSNAYGHGLVDFSREMERLGADFLGVDSIVEALALRRERIKLPILVLGHTLPEMLASASAQDISVTVSNFETIRYIVKNQKNFAKPLKIHIKADTGMHRQGFLASEMPKILDELKVESGKWKVEGLYTHFSSAKNPAFPKDTLDQIAEFKKWTKAFRESGLKPIVHASATGGAMLFPEAHFDMVRIGMGLYGLWPAKEVKAYLQNQISLKPVLVWKSLVAEVKKLPKGSRVGYDLTESMPRDGRIAIVPIGYWHGYPRSLSSIGRVMIGGKECKILGRVSMDILTVDVSGVPSVKMGDEAVIFGNKGDSPTSAEGIARLTDSSWYEILARLNPLIKRHYLSA